MTGTDLTQMQQPRFAGIPTFMRVPFSTDLSTFDIALAGVPFDGGVTARPGARFGAMRIEGSEVTRFSEKPESDSGWINGGFFVLSPEVGELMHE